jgi:molecular chaperone DnaK
MSEIDEIIMVGGQTRMPKIVEEVKKLFGKEPNRTINPDEVVALVLQFRLEYYKVM